LRALGSQDRVAAGDQPLAGEFRRADLKVAVAWLRAWHQADGADNVCCWCRTVS
jgi:hypothetical protein